MTKPRRFWIQSIPSHQDPGGDGWTIAPLIQDYPGLMGSLSVYSSSLAPGIMPHEIHQHPQEEIEVLLSGELEVVTPGQSTRIGPGSFHYEHAGSPHTIRGVGDEPARFLVIKWHPVTTEGTITPSGSLVFDAATLAPWEQRPGIQRQQLCPPITLANGARLIVTANHWPAQTGYPVHADSFDVMAILLRGRLSCIAHDTRAPAVIFYPAGVALGVAPVEDGPSLALYFHFYPCQPDSGSTEGVGG